ncbi:hypothetical protein [Thermodesulfatator autotrophicus]|uniref:Porin n=1 Tax=Thermodesulfatator autotrophicus TaxID=1795632 RepID=A0A177E5L4_9BACT|nr:hypothetical protein [Thermodesulfatator autotrophicus]OAG27257.1 hypothetical protein TH606_07865 [Thermodesulfatator autotrophicus]
MKYLVSFWCLVLSLFLAMPALASSDTEELKRMLEELKREVQQLKQENQKLRSEVEQLKGAPVAAAPAKHSFMSKGAYGSTPSGIDFYGFFKIDAVWQDSKAVGDNYVLWVLPGTSQNDGDNNFTLNYRHSRFGFDFSKPTEKFRVFGKMEMDFYTRVDQVNGGSYAWNDVHSPVRARRVFAGVEWGTWQLLAGLDWLTISQLYPHLSNFPSGSFMGNPGFRMTQVRLTKIHKIDDNSRLKIQVAAEQPYSFPTSTIGPYDDDPANDAGFPGIEARVAYEGKLNGKPLMFALWGHYSQEEYDISTGEKNVDSYSLGLEYKIPVPLGVKAFILGELWMGRNFDGYYVASVNQGTRFRYNDGTFDTSAANGLNNVVDVDEIDAVGGWIELEVFWTPKFVTHLGYGIDNPKNSDLDGVQKARLQQQMFYANFLYRLTKEFAVGAEYMYIETDYRQSVGGDGELNRFSGSLYYFF